jgi:predicted hydrocarbon binding protein
MDKKEIEEAINFYRKVAEEEIKSEKQVEGNLVGPKLLNKKDKLDLNEIITTERSFFSNGNGENVDKAYVTTFRMGNFNVPSEMSRSSRGSSFVGGMNLGSQLVQEGLIKDIDSLKNMLLDQKIGIIDVFSEESYDDYKLIDIRVYECIECAGLPNIGETGCYFEAGLVTGILKEIYNKEVHAQEKRCWTSGYSFCQFEVRVDQ